MKENTVFTDEQGRRWEVQILWGKPALPERGIFGARYTCLDDSSEAVRVGYIQEWAITEDDQFLLRDMLGESEPAIEIG